VSADGAALPRSPIENLTLRERVEHYLRDEILSGRFAAGEIISEVDLARTLGVSRGPVREAIGRLAAEGLVNVRPRRGALVASLSGKDFLDAYQVREALERLAIRLATPRLGAEGTARLRALHERMVAALAADHVDQFFSLNEEFHRELVQGSGNGELVETHRQLLQRMRVYHAQSLVLRGDARRSAAEHEAILAALEAGDADEAERLLAEHIQMPQRRLAQAADGDGPAAPSGRTA
jgi:DNA-binding GntR family transcriptional regulator